MNWKSFRNCQIALLGLLMVVAATSETGSQGSASPKGMVILTIAGDISQTNRGPMNDKRDAYFKYHDIKFDRAYQFDQTMLDQLKQGSVKVNPPQTDGPVVLKGALLSEVFKLVGVPEGASIRTVALDGFSTEIRPGQIKAHDWVLASTEDGKPLVIGAQGPLWMVYTPSKINVSEKEEHEWPWALFYIEVKK